MACFDQPNEFVEVVYDVPSRLPALLDSGEVDAILVSSIEYLRREDLVIAADVGIMSNGPVASVRMLSKVPLEEIRTLALDESSMTSNMLAQIILAEQGVRPSLLTMEPDQTAMLAACDACVLIGDKGLEADGTGLVDIDLGAAWTELTGEQFVWALWLAKRGQSFDYNELRDYLKHANTFSGIVRIHCTLDLASDNVENTTIEDRGPALTWVFSEAASRSGWSFEKVEDYLTHNVRYAGEMHRSLAAFQARLQGHNLLSSSREIGIGPFERILAVAKLYSQV